MFLTNLFGPCKNNDIEPINNNPSEPGILADNILFLLYLNLNIMTIARIAVKTIETKCHIFDWFNSMTCKQILIEQSKT